MSDLDSKLWPVSAELKELVEAEDEKGEEIPLPSDNDVFLQTLSMSQERLLTELASYRRWLVAQVQAAEAKYLPLIKAMNAQIKYFERKIDRVDTLLQMSFPAITGNEVYVNDEIEIHYDQSKAVTITDDQRIPDELVLLVRKPICSAIKERLQRGEEVPGAKLETRHHLRCGLGGAKAVANAKKRNARREGISEADEDA